MVEFLYLFVFGADHSNVLEDFLYVSFTSLEYVAMTRANALIDVLISRPLRWLAGSSFRLTKDWSPLSLGPIGAKGAADLVEEVFAAAALDGNVLLDPTLDIFKPLRDAQPLFREWHDAMFGKVTILAVDGKTKHLKYKLVRDELLNPTDPTNAATRAKTVEYLQVQCVAALKKMRDPKLAIADKLSSQGGANAFDQNAQAHADCVALDGTNDRLAESVFGHYDYVLRRCPGISMEAAAAIGQAIRAKSFAEGGAFHALPEHEQLALIELARESVRAERAVDREDHREHAEYHVHRRKTNSQQELVKRYALALSFFDRWRQRGVESVAAMRVALSEIATDQLKLDYLREQIEMRVIGLGFDEFKLAWSSSKDETIGTVEDLTEQLREVLIEQQEREACDELPDVAGTEDVQGARHADGAGRGAGGQHQGALA
jgi:hypothetical protein